MRRREHVKLVALLATAISAATVDPLTNQNTVTHYNDALGRSLADILGVICKAKLLALAADEFP